MRKTWIKIKRGLLTPQHRKEMGVRVWLFMYMIDRADWDTGAIDGWIDQQAADDMDMSLAAVRTQRRQLEEAGYIKAEQAVHSQTIVIRNWVNPREYSGEVVNPKTQGVKNLTPSTVQGVKNLTPYGIEQLNTLPYTHIKESQWVIPEHLNTDSFLSEWQAFQTHRKEIKKKLTPTAGERLLKKLGRYSPEVAALMLQQSIENGWTGVFDLKGKDHQTPPAPKAAQTWT